MAIDSNIQIDAGSKKAFLSIKNINSHSKQAIRLGWYFVGRELQKEGRQNIIQGPKTGKLYRIPGRRRRHRSSAPGESPANLSGSLQKSINFIVRGWDRMTYGAGSETVDYAKFLELGTSKMAERPYLIKAINNKQKETRKIMESQLNKRLSL